MTLDQVKKRVESLSPQTNAVVMDLTSTENQYEVKVISPAFTGKSTMERHQMIYSLFEKEMKTEEIHALSLSTLAPEQA